ncbi:MAG: glycosyltransferase [Bacteroidota bacterium]
MKHGIVIPCYNESKRLDSEAFVQYAKLNPQNSLCFVNDGSTDNTKEILLKIRRIVNEENVYIYDLDKNVGKADAVRQGAMFMFKYTDVDTIGFLDADLSTTLSEYDELTSRLDDHNGELKVVFGSRNLGSGEGIERNPLRDVLSKFIKILIQAIIKVKIADTQCGAKVFRRALIPRIYKNSFFSRWLFDVEIILRLKKKLGKDSFMSSFLEKPLNSWVHMEGSKLSLKDSIFIPNFK